MKVRIFVEGGGDRGELLTSCRRGFTLFFERAGYRGRMPKVVPCGGRNATFDAFCFALRQAVPDELPLLLVDSEAPVTCSPWEHVRNRPGDNWQKPPTAADNQLHLMVQVMESWFLADRQALEKFYGQGFKPNKLPTASNIETISKQQVYDTLEAATKETKTKGSYSKGSHSFQILGLIDPNKVRQASPNYAKRFFDTLETALTG